MFTRRNSALGLALAARAAVCLVAACLPFGAALAKYPSSPITLVVGFPPGGSNDIVARILAPKLSQILGVSVVIDNKPGANATIGTAFTARARPDGYTITLGSASPIAVSPSTFSNLPYNPLTDLTAITTVASSPGSIAVNPKLPAKTLQDLVALAKQRDITIASSGAGGLSHLTIELLKMQTGGRFVHVPYKGAGPAINDVVGGHVDGIIMDLPAVEQLVSSGQLRQLALTSDHAPANPKPGDPVIASTVVPGVVSVNWFMVMAPAKTPKDIVQKLHDALVAAVDDPAVRTQLANIHYETMTLPSPEAAQAFVKSETVRWGKVAKAAGVKAD